MQICDFLTVREISRWPLIRQIGVTHAVAKLAPELTGRGRIDHLDTFAALQEIYRENGFEIVALEGDQFDMSRIKEGLPGRDEDLESYARMVSHMGELGIPLLCYNFMVRTGWYRNRHDLHERGGALVCGFALEEESQATEEELLCREKIRDNYRYFLEAILPVAERAGVVLSLHPDDPPIPSLRGVGRIVSSVEDVDWALGLSVSPSHRLTFCQANFRLMDPDRLIANLHHFGHAGRIAYVHWRDVVGWAENFRETFHDNGPTDMVATLRAFREADVNVPIRVDHVPALHGEASATGYTMLGRLHAIGYLQGILEALGMQSEKS
jgi:mannonate dehydratase